MNQNNVDYKELYLHMMRQCEKAIRILVEAQRACEEEYLSAAEDPTPSLPRTPK